MGWKILGPCSGRGPTRPCGVGVVTAGQAGRIALHAVVRRTNPRVDMTVAGWRCCYWLPALNDDELNNNLWNASRTTSVAVDLSCSPELTRDSWFHPTPTPLKIYKYHHTWFFLYPLVTRRFLYVHLTGFLMCKSTLLPRTYFVKIRYDGDRVWQGRRKSYIL